jgi:tol-pal system protein YbgF
MTVACAADRNQATAPAQLDQRVERLERLLENQALVEILQRLEALQREVSALRNDTEVVTNELNGLKGRQRELYLDVDRRLQELEAAQFAGATAGPDIEVETPTTPTPPVQTPTPVVVTTPKPPATAPGVPSEEETQAYKAAFDLLKDGRYDSAIAAFRQFQIKYTNSAYADNAQYWLGEANYVSRQYAAALSEFRKVIEDHPDSSKTPDATLKLGFTYYELGQWENARKALTDVSERYPNTTVARLAEKRLKRMKSEGH